MLSISRNGHLWNGELCKISLDIFGHSILTREQVIVGYKGGGHSRSFC